MKNKLILITNQGLHPVIPKLKKQYGENCKFIILTEGNVELSKNFAKNIAKKTKDIIFDNLDMEIFVVWTGMPIYNTVVFNTAKEVTKKEPTALLWNKDLDSYEEYNLNPRELIFGELK